jgi:glycosyltransferase involved in cell wall biosynthesis
MRILYVHSGNLYGGVETVLLTLASHRDLCPAMEPHYALCFEGRLSEELAAAGVPVHLLGKARVSRPLTVWRARRMLGELLRHEYFDLAVCHSTWSQSLFGPVVRSHGLPLVFWLHNPTNGRHWLDRWGRRTVPDLALCNSQFTAQTLPSLYPGVRTEVVYCPVAPMQHSYTNADRAATRAELKTPEDATVIIQVSRMEPWKGHLLHLEALSKLKDLPGWMCWQVGGAQRPGEARYLSKLKAAAIQLGIGDRVRFLGQRSDVPRLLAAADIHCQPNTGSEPFGLTFIEALAARLPVVTTSIGGALEIINKSCGLLVPPDDVPALASGLKRLIQDRTLREKLGGAGQSRVSELCDVATQIQRLHQCFSEASKAITNKDYLTNLSVQGCL